ncbi:hypothetical protein C4K04_0825 [Pseudomonas chlororaphis]|uniref:Uncharacterized protein n=1 Tax=Pseudomonas chlororaphis TaxID=587753 RepID=A0A3G7THQ0_9PSED|nr:hypothetical protein C4K04_0825 [Pseudomonas chlororaphis]
MGCGTGACVIADGDASELSGRLSRGELRQCPVRRGLQQWYERPSLSKRKRRARPGAAKCAERLSCCNAGRKFHRLPQWADQSSRHPSLVGSDRASRRTLYRTLGEPPRKWRSLKGSGYLGRCCQRQRSVRQFLYPLEKTVKRHGQSVQKVATVATSVATLKARQDKGCRRCRRCRHLSSHRPTTSSALTLKLRCAR